MGFVGGRKQLDCNPNNIQTEVENDVDPGG